MNRTALLLALVLSTTLLGCVRREITVTSDPPGALVYMSDQVVGRTPVTTEFTWYGDYEVILRLEGYETLKTHTVIDAPWYDLPPIDLISQAFVPWTYHYQTERHFQLEPLVLPNDEQLLEQADQLQQENLQPVPR